MQRYIYKNILLLLLISSPYLLFGEADNLVSMLQRAHDLQNSNPNLSFFYCSEGIKTIKELERKGEYSGAKYGDLKAELFL